MFKVIVTHSDDPDSQSAVDEILAQCATDLAGVPQAGILFAAIDFEHALILDQIHQVYPDLDLIGCTTDGEISSRLGFQQDSLTLMLFCSDTVKISAGVGYAALKDPIAAAQQAVQQATASLTSTAPQLCILLPASYTADGSTTSGGDILTGLKLALGHQIPIIGGAAGDQYRFKKTYQFFRNQVLTDALPILLFSGDIQFSYGIGCGWTPIGNKGVVTKSQGTALYEIDGKPALEFYQRYLGDRPPTAENPLAVYEEKSNRCYMRAPNLYDQDSGIINFLGTIPEQATIQITDINRDELIQAAKTSFNHALSNYPGQKPQAILLFSCGCRRWLLGTRVKEEYQLVKDAFSTDLPICGFYTYGEFAPLEPQGETFYHQETFVTLLLGTQDQA